MNEERERNEKNGIIYFKGYGVQRQYHANMITYFLCKYSIRTGQQQTHATQTTDIWNRFFSLRRIIPEF